MVDSQTYIVELICNGNSTDEDLSEELQAWMEEFMLPKGYYVSIKKKKSFRKFITLKGGKKKNGKGTNHKSNDYRNLGQATIRRY